jgi:hypothetical protein
MRRFSTVLAAGLLSLGSLALTRPASATTCDGGGTPVGEAACYVITSGLDCIKENLPTKCL